MAGRLSVPAFVSTELIFALAAFLLNWPAAAADLATKSAAGRLPRKVIAGTVVQSFWEQYPGVQKRLDQLTGIVDRMQQASEKKYGRGLDLAVLPEVAVTGEGESTGEAVDWSLRFEGPVKDAFSREARKLRCYIVVPMYLLEDSPKKISSNVAILIGRSGEVVGIYRKLHIAVDTGSDSMEHGVTPGKEVPVFDCDFGKLGIQICFDIQFDYGWAELARKGAEIVAWPTQSPQTSQPAFRAKQYHYYIVSSTWRHNASIFEPTGKITSQVKGDQGISGTEKGAPQPPKDNVLVQELDLSYAILPWSRILKNGKALSEVYGDKVGYRYYEEEDRGIFWSNDPHITIGQMVRHLGLAEQEDELRRIGKLYQTAGVPGYHR
jgi:predicted amidohydrolase